MKNKQNLVLAAAIALALSSQQASAFDVKQYLPSWLGGAPAVNISVTPQPQAPEQSGQTGQVTPAVAPVAAATATPVTAASDNLALSSTERKIELPAVQNTYTVNPYTGVRANIDRRRGEIEQASLDSELAQKQIELEKQRFLLTNKDKIFNKELKERLGEGQGNRGGGYAGGGEYPANDILPKSNAKKKVAKAKPVEPIAYTPPPVYAPPPTQMVGVIDVGGIKKALLSVGGMSPVSVAAGDTFMGKRVTQVDSDSVMIDGAKVALSQSTNTLVNPDKQKLGAAAAGGVQTGANTPIGGPLGLPQTSTFNGIPMQAGVPASTSSLGSEFNQIMSPAQQANAEAMTNLEYGK